MAKKVTTAPTLVAETKSSKAILKSKYEPLMRRMIAGEKERAADAGKAREQIGLAVEKDNLHAKAFSWTKMLKKMTQAKRDELLFHLMTYFKYEGWPGEDMLADRSADDDADGDHDPSDDAGGEIVEHGDGITGREPPVDLKEFGEGATTGGMRKPGTIPPHAVVSDEQEDVRPRFLRRGSAAAPNPPPEDLMDAPPADKRH